MVGSSAVDEVPDLCGLTGGQPARGTEILSVRTRNTAAGSVRNVFVEDGLVAFVTRYHKGYEMSAREKTVHRYLPREVGELLVRYLWLVDPFDQRMQRLLDARPSETRIRELLAKCSPWRSLATYHIWASLKGACE